MPYRQMPERSRAREQLDTRILRRLRFLEQRGRYPGHSRESYVESVSTNTDKTAEYLDLEVEPGSWLVLASLNVVMAAANAQERAAMWVRVYDQESDNLLGQLHPTADVDIFGLVQGGRYAMPLLVHCVDSWEAPVRLSMTVLLETSGTVHLVDLNDLLLQAIPQ